MLISERYGGMDIGERKVIDSRTESSMASSWREYLCVERLGDEEFELTVRGYGYLGEVADYADEDRDFELPEEIDGQYVAGVEDGEFIVGGDLVIQSEDDGSVRFSNSSQIEVTEWLEQVKGLFHIRSETVQF